MSLDSRKLSRKFVQLSVCDGTAALPLVRQKMVNRTRPRSSELMTRQRRVLDRLVTRECIYFTIPLISNMAMAMAMVSDRLLLCVTWQKEHSITVFSQGDYILAQQTVNLLKGPYSILLLCSLLRLCLFNHFSSPFFIHYIFCLLSDYHSRQGRL